jgi:hypothetical protein
MLRLVWIYPDLLSTYGDRGNVLVLQRRARLRGIGVEIVSVNSDQPVPVEGDIYLLGGGEDLPQVLAARRLHADGGLNAAVSRGAVLFAVCAGYQLTGTEFGGVDGSPRSAAAADVDDAEPGSRLAVYPAELGSGQLVPRADREEDRAAAHRRVEPAVGVQPTGR